MFFHPSDEDLSPGTPVSTPATKTCRRGPRSPPQRRRPVAGDPGLHGERLLVKSGDAGIKAGANHFGGFLPLAENLPGFPDYGPLFYGHFTMLSDDGQRLSFSAMWDSS